jgi:hypothetical protein
MFFLSLYEFSEKALSGVLPHDYQYSQNLKKNPISSLRCFPNPTLTLRTAAVETHPLSGIGIPVADQPTLVLRV